MELRPHTVPKVDVKDVAVTVMLIKLVAVAPPKEPGALVRADPATAVVGFVNWYALEFVPEAMPPVKNLFPPPLERSYAMFVCPHPAVDVAHVVVTPSLVMHTGVCVPVSPGMYCRPKSVSFIVAQHPTAPLSDAHVALVN